MEVVQTEREEDLKALFNLHRTDKDRNGYTPVYHSLFKNIRRRKLKILEIGIGTVIPEAHSSMYKYGLPGYEPGGSLRAWKDYFPKSKIYGMDVQEDTQFTEDRITTFLLNSTDREAVNKFFEEHDLMFDIIIDDGDHRGASQKLTLKNFFHRVKPGGYYIVEDVLNVGEFALAPWTPEFEAVTGDALKFKNSKGNLVVYSL